MSFTNIDRIYNIDLDLTTAVAQSNTLRSNPIDFRIGGIIPSSLYTINSNDPDNNYLIIKNKTEFIDKIGTPPTSDHYLMTLFYLAGECDMLLYNDINDIRDEHGIFVFLYNKEGGANYVNDIISAANILMDFNTMIFSPVMSFEVMDKTLYNITPSNTPRPWLEDHIVLFYGKRPWGGGAIYDVSDLVRSILYMYRNNYFFCGIRYKSPHQVRYLSIDLMRRMDENNINYIAYGRNIINPKTISGLLVSDEIVYNFIMKNVRAIISSFVGYPNNNNTAMFIRMAIMNFMRTLIPNKCANVRYNIITVASPNNPDIIVVEFQLQGGVTRKNRTIDTIRINVRTINR